MTIGGTGYFKGFRDNYIWAYRYYAIKNNRCGTLTYNAEEASAKLIKEIKRK